MKKGYIREDGPLLLSPPSSFFPLPSSLIQPISLIILDKKYADKTVVMVNEQAKDY